MMLYLTVCAMINASRRKTLVVKTERTDMRDLVPDNFSYTAQFCEENIWWLAKTLKEEGVDPRAMQVLFFSNPRMQIVMLNQKAAQQGQLIAWDYHVVLKLHHAGKDLVLDFYTRLPFPCAYDSYIKHSFPDQGSLPEQYRSWMRVIPAEDYLKRFYSDRSHMRGILPESAFPAWDMIRPEHGIALQEYWDMEKKLPDGSYTCPILYSDNVITT